MSLDCINNNPEILRKWIERIKEEEAKFYKENPDSAVWLFANELRDIGFDFEIINQIGHFLPKYKDTILPIAIRYYCLAKERHKSNEQSAMLSYFHYKGFEEVMPMLLEDYYSPETDDTVRWFISDCFYTIRSKKYIDDYLKIISDPAFGDNRKMVILLVGKMKVENAIPILIDLLEDEQVRLHAISALGDFKREEFRTCFERFENSKHPGWRKYSRNAIKKLDKLIEKNKEK